MLKKIASIFMLFALLAIAVPVQASEATLENSPVMEFNTSVTPRNIMVRDIIGRSACWKYNGVVYAVGYTDLRVTYYYNASTRNGTVRKVEVINTYSHQANFRILRTSFTYNPDFAYVKVQKLNPANEAERNSYGLTGYQVSVNPDGTLTCVTFPGFSDNPY